MIMLHYYFNISSLVINTISLNSLTHRYNNTVLLIILLETQLSVRPAAAHMNCSFFDVTITSLGIVCVPIVGVVASLFTRNTKIKILGTGVYWFNEQSRWLVSFQLKVNILLDSGLSIVNRTLPHVSET